MSDIVTVIVAFGLPLFVVCYVSYFSGVKNGEKRILDKIDDIAGMDFKLS
jgi:hypothetical protein